MISLFVIIPIGTVPKGRLPFSLLCTGIRRMVSSQLPSVSVRGRSSVSAISSRNDSGTLSVLVRNSKSSSFGHTTFYPTVGKPLCLFHKAGLTIKIRSHLIVSFRLFSTSRDIKIPMTLSALINTSCARSWV